MTEISIPFHFKPREYQLPLLKALDRGIKRAVITWHRRSGKDKVCFNYMVKRACERVGTYFYFLPEYSQARKVIWDNIDIDGFKMIDHIPLELRKKTNDTTLKIELVNGSVIQLLGADTFAKSGVGTNPIGVVMSEYSVNNPEVWNFIRPILTVNGGWIIFNFTPRGQNHAFKLLEIAKSNPQEWFSEVLTIEDTKVLTKEDMDRERRDGMSEAMIDQEYYCKFIESATSFYKRIDDVCVAQDKVPDPLHFYQMGVDLAKYQDYTVISVIDLNTFEQVSLERFNQVDWNLQKAKIEATYHKWGRPKGFIDATGVGDPIVEDLVRQGVALEPIKFNEQNRKDILTNLSIKMEQMKIKLLNDQTLKNELSYFQYELADSGKLKIVVPEGLHDDCFVEGTMILTDKGQMPIETLKVGDNVMTRDGYHPIEMIRDRVKPVVNKLGLTGTLNHPVIMANGEEKDLLLVSEYDKIHIWNQSKQQIEKLSYIEAKGIIATQNQRGDSLINTTGGTTNGKVLQYLYTDKFGKIRMVKYLLGLLSTTRTAIHLTTNYLICKLWIELLTCLNTLKRIFKLEKGNVNFVGKNLLIEISMRLESIVVGNVAKSFGLKKGERVYNLQVANKPEYFANSILVHNCVFATSLSVWELPNSPMRNNRLNTAVQTQGITSFYPEYGL